MASDAPRYERLWVVQFTDPEHGGTVRYTHHGTDLATAVDLFVLGGPAQGRITNGDSFVVESTIPEMGGVRRTTMPTNLKLDNTDGRWTVDDATWHRVAVSVKMYTRTPAGLSTRFTGFAQAVNWAGGILELKLSTHDAEVLSTLVPRLTVDPADFPSATSVGAALPVVYGGPALLRPPEIGRDDTGDPGGVDYAVSVATDTRLRDIFWQQDQDEALERGTRWNVIAASFVSTTEIDTTLDVSLWVEWDAGTTSGTLVRCTVGGETRYSHVTNYDSGTQRLTVADAIFDAAQTEVALVGEYLVERGRYDVPTGSGGHLMDVRMLAGAGASGGLLFEAERAGVDNPADAIEDVLTDTRYGASESVNAGTFATAVTDYDTAGLGTAVKGVLAGDGRQVELGRLLDHWLQWRGAVLWDDGADWRILVDKAAAAATLELGHGPGTNQRITRVVQWGPASRIVREVELRAKPQGFRRGEEVHLTDWAFTTVAPATPGRGEREQIESRYLRESLPMRKVAAYRAKRHKAQAARLTIDCDLTARSVDAGTLVSVTLAQADEFGTVRTVMSAVTWRVLKSRESVAGVRLWCAGYDADMFTFDPADASTPTTPDPRIEETPRRAVNLLPYADFSAPLQSEAVDRFMVPGWEVRTADVADVRQVENAGAIGGWVLEVDSDVSVVGDNAAILSGLRRSIVPCIAGRLYFVSIYCDRGLGGGWHLEVRWLDSTGATITTITPIMRLNPGDVNPLGYTRAYVLARAPATTERGVMIVVFDEPSTTYKLDAPMIEEKHQGQHFPSEWTRQPRSRVDPAQMGDGPYTMLPEGASSPIDGRRELGAQKGSFDDLSVSTTLAAFLEAGRLYDGVTARVTTTITGTCTTWRLGDTARPDRWGSGFSKAAGTTVQLTDNRQNGVGFRADTDLVITGDDGTVTGGTVKILAPYTTAEAPTA